jgi:hypothetical protein
MNNTLFQRRTLLDIHCMFIKRTITVPLYPTAEKSLTMGSVGLATTHHLYPPFPENITTAPLVSISLQKLQDSDESESRAFFDAAKNLGFFYLDLEGSRLGESIVNGAESLQQLQQDFFRQSNEEKEEYLREKIDAFFGYRKVPLKFKHEDGTEMRNEMYNVSLVINTAT